jgi:hypothetical protein
VDEVLELRGVTDEEDRRVVTDEVVVALLRIELDRKATRVAHRVGAAELSRDGREAQEHGGPLAHLREEVGLAVGVTSSVTSKKP